MTATKRLKKKSSRASISSHGNFLKVNILLLFCILALAILKFVSNSVPVQKQPPRMIPSAIGDPRTPEPVPTHIFYGEPVPEEILDKKLPLEEEHLQEFDSRHMIYHFTHGFPERELGIQNNFWVVFPKTWTGTTVTNSHMRDDHGTVLTFVKGSDIIKIDQQLYETGACIFDQEEWGSTVMGARCKEITSVETPQGTYVVFEDIDRADTLPKQYSICKRTDTSCSPWVEVGEISLIMPEYSEATFQEFLGVVASIDVEGD